MPAWKNFGRKGLRIDSSNGCAVRNITPAAPRYGEPEQHNAMAGLLLCAFMALNVSSPEPCSLPLSELTLRGQFSVV